MCEKAKLVDFIVELSAIGDVELSDLKDEDALFVKCIGEPTVATKKRFIGAVVLQKRTLCPRDPDDCVGKEMAGIVKKYWPDSVGDVCTTR